MNKYKNLLTTSLLSGIGTLAKILTSIFSLKVIAIYTGPEGVGLLGQFIAVISILSIIAGGGINLGVIKYVAQYAYHDEVKDFIGSATAFTLLFSFLTFLIGIPLSPYLSKWLLGTPQYSHLFAWTATIQIAIALQILLVSILNGFGKNKQMVSINVISSFISMLTTIFAVKFFQVQGVLYALLIAQCLGCIIALVVTYREHWLPFLLFKKIRWQDFKNLANYSLMNVMSALAVPLAQILVRNDVSHLLGWEAVGYWQAVTRISDAYLIFVTTALTTYYLPKLSQLQQSSDLKEEIKMVCKVLLPGLVCILFGIYYFRGSLITLLYSSQFDTAESLFFYQLCGDFFRIAGWLFTYLLLAKSWTKTYIATEFFLAGLFVAISHYCLRSFGLIGLTYAFALTYCIYWILMSGIGVYFFKGEKASCPIMHNL